jgi:hypothetical protein
VHYYFCILVNVKSLSPTSSSVDKVLSLLIVFTFHPHFGSKFCVLRISYGEGVEN